ncbi:MAG TPA: hypothetical protein VJT49_27685 [Amycolatopsis sp.]|uniref:hypothetical protein n=1 Tax=Amycolatopsis sp. TaxID=37632 RepID=UPI002B459AAF|nr:hypothetical protein [Amycolatopsis sp.]HKS48823.1 hypothetical protein [Amycolatopsis sp.]
MTQVSAATRRRSARAGRWLVRALLVTGGALAGTAAAWVIGTASASADTATPVTDAVMAGADHFAVGAADLAGNTVDGVVRLAPDDRQAAGHLPAEPARDTLRTLAKGAVLHPAERLLGAVEQVTRQPQDAPRVIGSALTPPPDLLDFLRPGVAQLPALVGDEAQVTTSPKNLPVAVTLPAAQPGPVVTVPGATAQGHNVHFAAGRGHTGRDVARPSPFPFSPTHGPLVPGDLPLVPGGSASGGHFDGPLFGAPVATAGIAATDGRHAVMFGLRHTPVQPGAQPGVTPD